MRSLARRVWGTLAEPRVMTALAAASYVLLFVSSVLVDRSADGSAAMIVCDVLVKLGAAIALVAAWRGNRDAELPGAVLCGGGSLALAVIPVLAGELHEAWPGWHLMMALLVCSFLGQRVYYLYRHARNERDRAVRSEEEALEQARRVARALVDELRD